MNSDANREPLTCKVARIVSDRELILNRGKKDGVKRGTVFRILNPHPVDVKDPDTGELLGELRPVKVFVKAHDVGERMTIARTFRTRQVNVGGMGLGQLSFPDLFAPRKIETRVETLRVDHQQGQPLPASEAAVAIGDVAEEFFGDMNDVQTMVVFR